jgi:hypothetical protein
MINNYPLLKGPARTKAAHDTSHGHRARSWFLHNNAGSDDHQAMSQGPGHGAEPTGLTPCIAASPPPLPDPEVTHLRQVLEDVRFCLERGHWQAALATTHAALTRDKETKR